MIFRLPDKDVWFPDPLMIPDKMREDDGCFAVGGDLRPERLVEAYSQGIFPWSDFRCEELYWYCPMERFVIFPNEIHISHSMRTLLNKDIYRVSMDCDFKGVIHNCSQLRIAERGAWLGTKMVKAYTKMHELGYAHSVEVWRDDTLVGGLYGMSILNAFCGESMFSLEPNTSKIALIHLCRELSKSDRTFIDCQFETSHLRSMGGRFISYSEYMERLWQGYDEVD